MSAGPSAPRLAVIVACTRPGRVGELVDAVCRQATPDCPVEVVIVGATPKGSIPPADHGRGWHGVRALPEHRLHPNRRRNRGVAMSTAPILAFLDDDAAPEPGWLRAAGEIPTETLEIRTGPEVPWGGSDAACLCHSVATSRMAEGTRAHGNHVVGKVHWSEVPFCNLVTNRAVLTHVGRPSEDDVWDIDDFEFCRRAAKAGVVLMNDPALAIRHDRYPDSVLRWLREKASDRFRTGEKVVSHAWLYRSVPGVAAALLAPWMLILVGVFRPRRLVGCLAIYLSLVGVEANRIADSAIGRPTPLRFGAVLVSLHVVSISALYAGVATAAVARFGGGVSTRKGGAVAWVRRY